MVSGVLSSPHGGGGQDMSELRSRLRDLAVVAEWVRLDRRVELDGALQDAGLGVQLLSWRCRR